MKFRTKKAKPPVGMELSMTLSMATDLTPEQSAEAVIAFSAGLSKLANDISAVWVRMLITGIPEELEGRIQAALDEFNAAQEAAKPKLRIVIDNSRSKPATGR